VARTAHRGPLQVQVHAAVVAQCKARGGRAAGQGKERPGSVWARTFLSISGCVSRYSSHETHITMLEIRRQKYNHTSERRVVKRSSIDKFNGLGGLCSPGSGERSGAGEQRGKNNATRTLLAPSLPGQSGACAEKELRCASAEASALCPGPPRARRAASSAASGFAGPGVNPVVPQAGHHRGSAGLAR
jgi:hypothetical protein